MGSEREREREKEGAPVNRLFIRTSKTTRSVGDSIFLEEIYPPKAEEFEEFQSRQFAVLIEADAALMKRSNRVFG